MVHFQRSHHLAQFFFVDVPGLVLVELLEEVHDLLELEGREVVDVLVGAPAWRRVGGVAST